MSRGRARDAQTDREAGRSSILPPDVSDVFVAGGVGGVPVMTHGSRRAGRGRLAVDCGLVVLGRLQRGGDRER